MTDAVSVSAPSSVDSSLLQRRVGGVWLVLALIGGTFVLMRLASVLAMGHPEYLKSRSLLAHYGGIIVSLGMWLGSRRSRPSSSSVYAIELVGLTAVCSLYGVMATGMPQAFRPEMTMLLASGVFLLAHAIHVPSTWRWTAVLAAVLAVPLIASTWVILTPMDPRLVEAAASAPGSVQRTAASLTGVGMANVVTWWVIISATAAAASAVIHGLRREVLQARQLGQYTLERKLGEGGMAVVYLANHAMLKRPTAVKVFSPERVGEMGLARFEREVRATARLAHPNTVTIFDYGRTPAGLFYYAMELLDGASLAQIVEVSGPMPAGRVVHIVHQVADALAEAHDLGLIHRDIKPANIMLTQQGGAADVAKVVDFGLVKTVEERGDPNQTGEHALVGTPQFMAPEAILGHEDGPARDLYALGCVAYYLLTAQHVFSSETLVQVLALHAHAEPEPPSKRLGTPIPADLETLVLQLLAKPVQSRPASARAVCLALEGCACFGTWSQSDARRWWRERGPELRQRRKEKSADLAVSPLSTPTLAVDLSRRG